jgi:hypothetical protein
MKVSSHANQSSLSARLRRDRMRYLDGMIHASGRRDLLLADLGGTRSFWEMNLPHLKNKDCLARIDIFNLDAALQKDCEIGGIPVRFRPGDVTNLSDAADGQYDIAFSNSVIEHVGNLDLQNRAACEIRRIARDFMVQTPNLRFPLEPHFYVPLFPFLPLGVRAWLHQHFKLGWLPPEPDALRARIDCDQIRLLSQQEIRLLFPGAAVYKERLAGMVKSFIVIGKGGS